MSPLPRPTRRRSSRAARPSWADHVPRRLSTQLSDRLSDRLPAQVSTVVVRRSAVAVLTATALLGGGAYTATALTTDPGQGPVAVLGLTATGACDNRKAARQHAAATATRAQARALLTDLTLSDDPADHALAGQITDLGFRPATESVEWRQQAVDLSDQLHHLNSAEPHIQEVGVRLAAAGLGPTPADLMTPPPAADLVDDTASGASAAVSALDQARSAITTPATAAAPTDRAEQPRAAAPPVPAACTDQHRTAPPPAPPPASPGPPPTAASPPTTTPTPAPTPSADPRPNPGNGEKTGARTTGSGRDDDNQVATDPAPSSASPPPASSSSNRVVTDVQTSPGQTPSTEDVATARAAIGMVTDLLAAIRADGSGDATQVGVTVLDALDRDRLAALGADPADLAALDQLRTTTDTGSSGSGSGSRDGETEVSSAQTSRDDDGATDPSPTPNSTPNSEPAAETSAPAVDPRPGAAITRTQTSRNGTTTSNSGGSSDGDGGAGGAAGGGAVSSSAGAVSAGIEKLTAQARAAAEVDPVAQDLLDALDRTSTSTGAGTGVKGSRTTSTDSGTGAAGNDTTGDAAAGERAEDGVAATDDHAARGGAAGEQPRRAGVGAEPPPVTDGGVATSAAGSTWDKLAHCESGGNWSTNTGNGYAGGLQFSPSTWRAFGGEGAAHEASRAEQIEVAQRVQAVQGWAAWPACSKRLGLR
ncbi:transglycosylase family protein [Pseudonocardia sp. ICBG601]|uniref:transglycosylase family protein n=1 Tax=Pseudonocardia sp. ICBG601 TaxID=2846759 RepID=UPI0035ABBB11